MMAGRPRILLCASDPRSVADVRLLLEHAGHTVTWHGVNGTEPEELASSQLIILDGSQNQPEALGFCRRLRARLLDSFIPILFVSAETRDDAHLASLGEGADTYLMRPFAPIELLGQVGAFLRIKELHDRLVEKSAEIHRINRRLQQAYQQIDQELELARRIQLSLLPQTLPDAPRIRFAVHYRLCGQVGGDFYDAFRLDENHVGFYVADAMGHGVPASLLTIFIKKGVKAKQVVGHGYRLLAPTEVLQRLNRDLMDQGLSENPFITMAYVLYNHAERTLHFARAGHPYPLYVPREGEPRFWQVQGSLLGVFDTSFPGQSHRLRVGDKVLLYSDGIDTARFEDHPAGGESLRACAARHQQLPIAELVSALALDLFGQASPPDDLTLLGMEALPAED
jgi:sigma-B regulation protein RsbU (phosphoserine phosphatase)